MKHTGADTARRATRDDLGGGTCLDKKLHRKFGHILFLPAPLALGLYPESREKMGGEQELQPQEDRSAPEGRDHLQRGCLVSLYHCKKQT